MGRLNEVREEIEQLVEEIERDARRARHHPSADDQIAPGVPLHIHLVVSGDLSRVHLKISLQEDDEQKRR